MEHREWKKRQQNEIREEETLSWNHELRPLVHNSRLYQQNRGAYQMAKHTKELNKGRDRERERESQNAEKTREII